MYSQLYLDPKYHISDLEWQVLQDIYDILEPLHAVQTLMGAEMTPMAPLYFPFYFGLITALEKKCSEPRYAYLNEVFRAAISKLKEHLDDMRFSKAVILSTIIHPALRFRWFKENWPQHHLHEAQRIILREVSD
ncbi:hypothetical protein M422DRAFT_50556 [Sphaerobolus stellatus SS14]|uniref:Uncharacterized protein n=1 Tax=Sphaerobolus stellatus (strain SS14) TaxID=990650 RepID=A0A0C9VI91_SPHS4|nr:hypothetical protein M422DRAFT_50556 [Sphaerobolus stellatus SS14]